MSSPAQRDARPLLWTKEQIRTLNRLFRNQSPQALLQWGLETFGHKIVLGTGFGPSGLVLMHMLSELDRDVTIFYLDTDLLFPETYALRDRLAERLGIQFTPVAASLTLEEQAAAYGPELWQQSPDSCCHLRKVIPLRRYLAGQEAWITGLRRDQSPSRSGVELVEWSQSNGVLKLNPLVFWSEEQIWDYIHEKQLPYNPLHEQGYVSIGCLPCTRAVRDGEDGRAGRWAGRDKLECGIHIENGRVQRDDSFIPLRLRQS